MGELMIHIADDRNTFQPGEDVTGQVSWQLQNPIESMELRLSWTTRGKGTTDSQIVQTLRFDKPMLHDQRPFQLALPQGPVSFSGVLISLIWKLELVAQPGGERSEREVVISPTGREIELRAVASHS